MALGDKLVRYRLMLLAFAVSLPLGCAGGGNFTFLGYSTKPPFEEKYRTIYVPVFQNRAFQSGPLRGLENDLTLVVQKQIEQVTPYKIVSYREGADTELIVTIVDTHQNIFNRTQLNEIRGSDVVLQVELVWRDLRTGEILSKSKAGPGALPLPAPLPLPGEPNKPAPAPVAVLTTTGTYMPELGQSQATALQKACKQMAVEIVSLMEKPW
jgi:hypothetical protein